MGSSESREKSDAGRGADSSSSAAAAAAKATASKKKVTLSTSGRERYCALILDRDYVIADVVNDGIWDATFARTSLSVPRVAELEAASSDHHHHHDSMDARRLTSSNVIGQPLSAVLGRDDFSTLVEVVSGSSSSSKKEKKPSSAAQMQQPISLRWQVPSSRSIRKKGASASSSSASSTTAADFVLFLQGVDGNAAVDGNGAASSSRKGGMLCCSAPKKPATAASSRRYNASNENGSHHHARNEDNHDDDEAHHTARRRKAVRQLWIIPSHFAAAEKSLSKNAAQLYECVQCKQLSLDTAEEVYATPQTLLSYLASTGVTLLHNISLTSCSRCLEGLSEATRRAKEDRIRALGKAGMASGGGGGFGGDSHTTGEQGETTDMFSDNSSLISDAGADQQQQGNTSFWRTTPGSERLASPHSPTHVHVGPKGKVGSVVSTSLFAKRGGTAPIRPQSSSTGRPATVSASTPPSSARSLPRPQSARDIELARRRSVLAAAGGDEDDMLDDDEDDDVAPAAGGRGGGLAQQSSATFGPFVHEESLHSPTNANNTTTAPSASAGRPSPFAPKRKVGFSASPTASSLPRPQTASSSSLPTVILFIEEPDAAAATRRALMSKGILVVDVKTIADMERHLSAKGRGISAIIASMLNRGVSVSELVAHLNKKANRTHLAQQKLLEQQMMFSAEDSSNCSSSSPASPHLPPPATAATVAGFVYVPPIVAMGASHFSGTALSAGCSGFVSVKKGPSSSSSSPAAVVDVNEVVRVVVPFIGA